ncbi:PadR family transcriptional regulator [Gloeobacter morelensis]|uniref:PadR family transcriptional regulator n=1 Tax=Gloeobacter morelensis MG652769 TaxID=2781736 RepID=A0ABY3PPU5_9CYAN|nr:PadR family transcriptional regulator [Gloeobacter morelensis]UFP95664.1 PadR family transcriptional regulator [Gloeobacter morelensis MG652769]
MALAHAILALLADRSFSGYELTKEFEGSVGCFWKATHQQIYRELAALEERRFVHADLVAQEGRPNKKLYELTEAGKRWLSEWMAEPSEPCAVREDMLVKTFAGYLTSPEVLIADIERRKALHAEKLAYYRQIEREHFSDLSAIPIEKRFGYLSLKRGLRYEADWVAWCDEAAALLRSPSFASPG